MVAFQPVDDDMDDMVENGNDCFFLSSSVDEKSVFMREGGGMEGETDRQTRRKNDRRTSERANERTATGNDDDDDDDDEKRERKNRAQQRQQGHREFLLFFPHFSFFHIPHPTSHIPLYHFFPVLPPLATPEIVFSFFYYIRPFGDYLTWVR